MKICDTIIIVGSNKKNKIGRQSMLLNNKRKMIYNIFFYKLIEKMSLSKQKKVNR